MTPDLPIHWPSFYTATMYKWLPLLTEDKYKNIIVESLQFLTKNKRIELNAFAIMNTHIHLIWQILPGYTPVEVQRNFMKYTAQQLKLLLIKDDNPILEKFRVDLPDRKYQFWKREALSVELFNPDVFDQKLEYIHENPVKAGIYISPENYYYSSSQFYSSGVDIFEMLTHYKG